MSKRIALFLLAFLGVPLIPVVMVAVVRLTRMS